MIGAPGVAGLLRRRRQRGIDRAPSILREPEDRQWSRRPVPVVVRVVVVVLEETFTPAEKTLIARGESEGIQDIRRRFQRAMAEQFKAIIEQSTGRRVRSFLSETDLEEDLSVELFILADDRTDMTAYERTEGAGGEG